MPQFPLPIPSRSFRSTRVLLAAACAIALGATSAFGPAFGQISKLDPGVLIDGMRREKMTDLLTHLGETDKNMPPQAAKQLLISQLLISYDSKKKIADAEADPEKATELRKLAYADFKRASDERKKLIADFPNDENRPTWQTDLGEQLIFEDLQVNNQWAAEFYEFGVPTAEQKEAFETTVVQLIQQLSLADLAFNKLMGELAIKPDHTEKRINTGWWERWTNQYFKLREPYFLAYASYYTTLLPENHLYWKTVGGDPLIGTLQKRTPDEERKRLLTQGVIEKLEPFVKDKTDPFEIRRPSMLLTARAMIALKRVDEARRLLTDPVFGEQAEDIHGLLAQLTLASLDASNPKTAALAFQRLNDLGQKGMVRSGLLYRVLVVDATHRIRMRDVAALPADKKTAAIAAAYEPYQVLLNDPSLGEAAAGVREFIYNRWESSIPESTDLSTTPPIVVAAIGEIARNRGQYFMIKGAEAEGDGRDKEAKEFYAKGKPKLLRAIKVNEDLLKRPNLTEIVSGQALYNQAVAQYFLDQQDGDNQRKTAKLLEKLAREHPTHPQAEDAITNAIKLMFTHRRSATPQPGVIEEYRAIAKTLLEKFPNSQAAVDERLYYVETELVAAGKLEEAAAILAKSPQAHRDYFSSQGLYIYCLFELFRKAPLEKPKDKPDVKTKADYAEILRKECPRVTEAAEAAMANAPADQVSLIRRVAGWSRLRHGDVLLEDESKGNTTEEVKRRVADALAVIFSFDDKYKDEPDLMREMLARRITWLFKIGRFDAKSYDDGVKEADRMMERFPDDAASVIDTVVTELERSIDDLRDRAAKSLVEREKKEFLDDADKKGSATTRLAMLLNDWAEKKYAPLKASGKAEDAAQYLEQMLPFRLLMSKSFRLAKKYQESLDLIKDYNMTPGGAYATSGPLMSGKAEALYGLATSQGVAAGRTNYIAAAGLYNQIIKGLRPENNAYPLMYWNAWMRTVQIMDLLNENVKDIPLRVQQLQLTDPNLGGEPYKSEMKRLEIKHSGN